MIREASMARLVFASNRSTLGLRAEADPEAERPTLENAEALDASIALLIFALNRSSLVLRPVEEPDADRPTVAAADLPDIVGHGTSSN